MQKFKKVTLALVLIASLFDCLGKDILDPNSKYKNLFLAQLSPVLNKYKIDVMQDWSSNVTTNGNPVLAPLAKYIGMLDSTLINKNTGDERWASEFYDSHNGILIGVKGKTPVETALFREAWDITPSEQRVFISFAKEDALLAKNIRTELQAKGYQVFIYYDGEDKIIRSAEDIAYYMQTADNCLVIDTHNARSKYGVLAEALAHSKYIYKRKVDIVKVFGRTSCPRTSQALEEFRKTNAKVIYYDIDTDPIARAYLEKNSAYLEKPDLLPLIVVNGKPIKINQSNLIKALDQCNKPITYRPY